jgi:hypothetical protein
MYFEGVPTHAQAMVPVPELNLGVMVIVTVWPVDVVLVVPTNLINPAPVTVEPVPNFPTTPRVKPDSGVASLLSGWYISATAVRIARPAGISSDTLARAA